MEQPAGKPLLLDLPSIDLTRRVADRESIGKLNPHRGQIALIDAIVWNTPDFKQGVAVWNVKADEFWVPGHFPGRPMLPGVLQVEAGAQLSVWLYNARWPVPKLCAFTRIENAVFRNQVVPGDEFFVLASEIKANERRFVSNIQGVVNGKVAFEAIIHGMSI